MLAAPHLIGAPAPVDTESGVPAHLATEFAANALAVGAAFWLATLASGVHATIAGVLMGILASAYPPSQSDLQRTSAIWRTFREQPTPEYARSATRSLRTTISPNERLQHLFHPWVSYAIVPVFALANAGIVIDAGTVASAVASPITIGVVLGLVAVLKIANMGFRIVLGRTFNPILDWPLFGDGYNALTETDGHAVAKAAAVGAAVLAVVILAVLILAAMRLAGITARYPAVSRRALVGLSRIPACGPAGGGRRRRPG